MDFELREDERLFLETARRFAADRLAPEVSARDRGAGWSAALWDEARDLGLLAVVLPEEHQGLGLGPFALSLVLRELARSDAAMALAIGLHNLGAAAVLAQGVAADQAEALASGTSGVGFVFGGMAGDGAAVVGVIPRLETAGAWVVLRPEASAPASLIGSLPERALVRSHCLALDQLTWLTAAGTLDLPQTRLADGAGLLAAVLVAAAAVSCGVAEQAVAEMSRYALERQQFGRSIASFQDIQWMIADSETALQASSWAISAAASEASHRPAAALAQALQAKLLADRAMTAAGAQGFQVHGGYGYTKDYPIERLFREAQVLASLPFSAPACKALWAALTIEAPRALSSER